MIRILLAAVLLSLASSAWAQNVNCPNRPLGDSTNACANTRFVIQNAGGGGTSTLTNTHIFVGNASNVATDVAMSGDCVIVAVGAITCTATNGVAFGSFATGTNAANLTGTLAAARLPAFGSGDVSFAAAGGAGTIANAAVTNAKLANPSLTIGTTNIPLGTTATNIAGIAAPVAGGDATNKTYVDNAVAGLTCILSNARLATTAALAANTYANGASGVGATLTANANGAIANIDGTAVVLNDILLINNEVTAANRGLYTATALGDGSNPYILTRITGLDQAAEMQAGCHTFITAGATNINKTYTLQATVTTVGTTAVSFAVTGTTITSQWTGTDPIYFIGNVGVGTTAPSSLGTGLTTTTLNVHKIGGAGQLSLSGTSTADGTAIGLLSFGTTGASTNTASAGIASILTGSAATNASGNLAFFTRNGTSIAQNMTIDKDGNVGIGTIAPTARLHTVNGVRFESYPSQKLLTSTSGQVASALECKPIEAYGGAASNSWSSLVTDNVAAWNAFIAIQSTNNMCIEFGPGIYWFSTAILATLQGSASVNPYGQGLTIKGSGMEATHLYFYSSTNGIQITYTEASYAAIQGSWLGMQDLSVVTCAGSGNSLAGLILTGNSTAGNVPKSTLLQNLTFRPAPTCAGEGGSYWGTAISLSNMQNVDYDHISVWGANQGYSGVGIAIDGGTSGGASTSHRFSHLRMFFIGTGINITGHAEGVSSQHHDFVHVDKCFKADVFSGAAQSPEYRFVNGECAARTTGIEWNGVAIGEVAGNLFYSGSTASDTTGIALTNTTSIKIHDNHFEAGSTGNKYGITVDTAGTLTNIHDNMLANYSNSIWLKAGTSYGIIRNNIIITGAACTNSGTNSTLSGNILVTGVTGTC